MSEAEDKLVKHIEDMLKSDHLSAHGPAKLERRLAWFKSPHNQPEVRAFMKKLKSRQGTIMPDFTELYRRKVELDRHEPRP